MSSSVGMIIPNIWNNKIHVPNHQPEKHDSSLCQEIRCASGARQIEGTSQPVLRGCSPKDLGILGYQPVMLRVKYWSSCAVK